MGAIESCEPLAAVNAPAPLTPETRWPVGRTVSPIVLANASLTAGGAERQVINLLCGLAERGHSVSLLTLHLNERPELSFFLDKLQASGLKARNVKAVDIIRKDLIEACGSSTVDAFWASIQWAPLDIRTDIFRLAGELYRIRPTVVHGWQDATGIIAAFAALAVNTPRIVISGRNVHPDHFSHARPYMRRAMHYLVGRPEVVLTNNSTAGAHSYADWLRLEVGQIPIVRNGIEPQAFVRPSQEEITDFRRRLGVASGATLIGGSFRMQVEKRPLLWLEVAKRVNREWPNAQFVIFGDGTMYSVLQKAAIRFGLAERLALPGHVANMRLALAALDVMLLTSAQEGTPNVVLEANCLGVPVVATDAGGTGEAMIDGVTGLLVREATVGTPGGLADALAEGVIRVLTEVSLREAVRHVGPAFVTANFGYDRMINEMLALYVS